MSEATAAVEVGDRSFFAQKLTIRQKMTRRIIRWFLITGVLIVAAVVVLQSQSTPIVAVVPSPAEAETLPVATMLAKRSDSYSRERTYTGLLKESRRSQLSFQRGGELLELSVDEGQVVEAGQQLGRLDARHIRAERARLEAQVHEAKAMLDELIAGPRKETIAAKRAELRAQESQRRILESQLARRKQLLQSASVSREEYETFLHDFEAAAARVDVVQKQLDEMLAGTRAEQIAAQRARLAQLDAQLTDIAHDLQDTLLVAPFAGRVAKRFVDEGNVIAAGTPIVEIIDDANVEAWVGLPPAAARALQVGERHRLTVDGVEVEAEVKSLAPDVQRSSRTRTVILRLLSDQSQALPGQVVRLAVTEQVDEPGYWLPTTSLAQGTRGLWSVFVVEQGVVARRDVELLDTVGTESFVRGTLQPGDQIVASGTHRVVVGQQVSTQSSALAQRAK